MDAMTGRGERFTRQDCDGGEEKAGVWDATRDGRASHVRDTRVCVERRDGKVRGERSAARPIVRANHYQSLGVTGPTGTTQDPRPSLSLSAQIYNICLVARVFRVLSCTLVFPCPHGGRPDSPRQGLPRRHLARNPLLRSVLVRVSYRPVSCSLSYAGFNACLFGSYIYITRFRRVRRHVTPVIFWVAVLMFCFSTVHVSLGFARLIWGFIDHRDDPGGPEAFFSDVSQPPNVAKVIIHTINSILGDGIVVSSYLPRTSEPAFIGGARDNRSGGVTMSGR